MSKRIVRDTLVAGDNTVYKRPIKLTMPLIEMIQDLYHEWCNLAEEHSEDFQEKDNRFNNVYYWAVDEEKKRRLKSMKAREKYKQANDG